MLAWVSASFRLGEFPGASGEARTESRIRDSTVHDTVAAVLLVDSGTLDGMDSIRVRCTLISL